jgi:hypothetical protein
MGVKEGHEITSFDKKNESSFSQKYTIEGRAIEDFSLIAT